MVSSSGTLETPVSLDGILQRLIDLEPSFLLKKEINKTLRINIEDIQKLITSMRQWQMIILHEK